MIGSLVYGEPQANIGLVTEHGLSENLMGTPAHREVFRVVVHMLRSGERVRIGALLQLLSPQARKAVGDYEGLARISSPDWLDNRPSLPELSRELKRQARERVTLVMLDEARAAVMARRPEAIAQLKERLDTLATTADLDHEQRAWRPLREVVMEKMVPALTERDAEKRKRAGVVPTGLTRLDSVLDGGAPRSLWVLAADPGAGKTGFMVRCSMLQRALGLVVGVMPLEDPSEKIYGRPVAERAGLPWHTLTSRDVDEKTALDAHEALEQLHHLGDGLWVTDSGRTSTTEVLARLEQLYVQTNGTLDCVWIDNSNEIRLDFEDHHRHMDDLLLTVREWANRRKVSVCFLTHLKRDERKQFVIIRQADLAHTAGFARLGRLVLGLRQTDQAEEPAIAVDHVKGNDSKFKSLFLCFSERGAMPLDREARMRARQKKKADKQAALFGGGKGEAETQDAA